MKIEEAGGVAAFDRQRVYDIDNNKYDISDRGMMSIFKNRVNRLSEISVSKTIDTKSVIQIIIDKFPELQSSIFTYHLYGDDIQDIANAVVFSLEFSTEALSDIIEYLDKVMSESGYHKTLQIKRFYDDVPYCEVQYEPIFQYEIFHYKLPVTLCCLSTLDDAEIIKQSGISQSVRHYFRGCVTKHIHFSFIRKHRDVLIKDEKYAKIFIKVNMLPDDVIFYINQSSYSNDNITLFTNSFIDKDYIDVIYLPVNFWNDKKIICLID